MPIGDLFSTKEGFAPATILVVDDEEPVRRMMEKCWSSADTPSFTLAAELKRWQCASGAVALSISW